MLLTLMANAWADPVDVKVERFGQVGTATPALVLLVNDEFTDLSVSLKCGAVQVQRSGAARTGEELRMPVEIPVGKSTCSGTLSVVQSDGSEGEMPLRFDVEMFNPLKIEVPRDQVNLKAQTLVVRADRPIGRVEVSAWNGDGKLVGNGTGGAGTVKWDGSGEVVRIEVKVVDEHGFYSEMMLFPWFYNIPHEDVVFATAKWDITETEEPKLVAAKVQADEVVRKYGEFAKVNLYVAGYTDTTGDNASNQTLSEQRAKAIATWYRKAGFQGDIYYQGFGESAPAVATGDGVDEARNRRAVYILAAEQPPNNGDIPRSNWKKLD